jgi:hypothetical protein
MKRKKNRKNIIRLKKICENTYDIYIKENFCGSLVANIKVLEDGYVISIYLENKYAQYKDLINEYIEHHKPK